MIDLATEYGARVARRLQDELIIWLTTVRADLLPQPSPVWFFWDGASVLIYSRPRTPKLRNVARHPKVALHLDGDRRGGNIVIFAGEAAVDEQAPPADQHAAYIVKYQERLAAMHMTPAAFARLQRGPANPAHAAARILRPALKQRIGTGEAPGSEVLSVDAVGLPLRLCIRTALPIRA